MHLPPIFVLTVLLTHLGAQTALPHALVASKLAGPQAQLLDVDLATGTVLLLGRFPADAHAPLALSVDPVRREGILAIDMGATSRILRLSFTGLAVAETVLADVPGVVSDLLVTDDADVFAASGGSAGAIWRVPRNGGTPQMLAAVPRASALFSYGLQSATMWIAESGSSVPAIDPQIRLLDVQSRQTVAGPYAWPGFQPALTGIADLPTGLIRQLVSDASGTIALSVNFAVPLPLQITPAVPPGGTRALRMATAFDAVVLGGAAHPYLKTFSGYSSPQAWRILAGPLPGDPVAFALLPADVADVVPFGRPCGGVYPSITSSFAGGPPRLGNASFALELYGGIASARALLVLGASDQRWLGLPLPLVLQGGCGLYASADVAFATTANAQGMASAPLPIPNLTALNGAIVFAQWFQAAPAILGSNAAALHLRP